MLVSTIDDLRSGFKISSVYACSTHLQRLSPIYEIQLIHLFITMVKDTYIYIFGIKEISLSLSLFLLKN